MEQTVRTVLMEKTASTAQMVLMVKMVQTVLTVKTETELKTPQSMITVNSF